MSILLIYLNFFIQNNRYNYKQTNTRNLSIYRDENGRERAGKPSNHSRHHIFLTGIGNGNVGRKNEIGNTGHREQKSLIGNMPVTVGNRELKTGIYM